MSGPVLKQKAQGMCEGPYTTRTFVNPETHQDGSNHGAHRQPDWTRGRAEPSRMKRTYPELSSVGSIYFSMGV